jgi:glycosyltransferase involved in cell wall biosynthesis
VDRLSCRLSDAILVDTQAQAEFFRTTFSIPAAKIKVLYLGCDLRVFRPEPEPPDAPPTILFYGTFLPLHGIDVIVRAARLLQDESLRIHIIGAGQEYARIRRLAEDTGLTNVLFQEPVSLAALPQIIAQSTICLGGHFGPSAKAGRVIAGKAYQCMAAGRPTILGDNPANRELFTHGKDAWMCPMGSPEALAESIRLLLAAPDLRRRLGIQARATVERTCSQESMSAVLEDALTWAVASHHAELPSTRAYTP